MADDDHLTPAEAEALLSQYRRMAFGIANAIGRRWDLHGHDREDLEAEVMLGFVEATRTFRKNIPVPFGLYARRAGYRRGWMFCGKLRANGFGVGREARRAGSPLPRLTSYDAAPGDDATRMTAATIVAREGDSDPDFDQDAWWAEALSGLSPRGREIVELAYREGLNQSEIGRRLGITQSAVWLQLKRAMARLRAHSGTRT